MDCPRGPGQRASAGSPLGKNTDDDELLTFLAGILAFAIPVRGLWHAVADCMGWAGNADAVPELDGNGYADAVPDGDGDRYTNTVPDGDGNRYADAVPDGDGNRHADAVPDGDGNRHADADGDGNGYADAVPDADRDGDRYPYADAGTRRAFAV
ncbi:MSCRAMM family adhesin SdrC [Arthrobacter sp. AK04]|uniref:MSCRAMM family adhesin SdrC n=1 Tax=Arthrobacter sp. AK04 TaxID=2900048 RepID=UPI001E430036|nr:MSCRAMM family adhesin SdrC [Arthrobacter sp. AK04]MCD5342425.1 MSCRAMM family adhesin SdrC [Arthrobacter sp. AK04]